MIGTVFLDRDGTVNVKAAEGAYVTDPAELVLLPGAAAAVRRLNDAGIVVVLVTNQRGMARGLLSAAGYAAVAARLRALLAAAGARLDAEYVCPHEVGCDCRKPRPGMVLRAAAEHPGIRLDRSVLIGDAESDVAAGIAAGIRTVRLGAAGTATTADSLCPDLAAAVDRLLARGPDPAGGPVPAAGTGQPTSDRVATSSAAGTRTGG